MDVEMRVFVFTCLSVSFNQSAIEMFPTLINVSLAQLGNGMMAKMYGGQMYDLFVREGWHCIFDSHAALNKKPGAAGSASSQVCNV